MKKRVILMVALFILILLLGCAPNGCDNINPVQPTDYTSTEIKVNIPESVFVNGLYLRGRVVRDRNEIKSVLLSWVEARIEEWLNQHRDRNRDELLNIAKSFVYVLKDCWAFPCSASKTGLCAGTFGNGEIKASIYIRWDGYEYPPKHLNSPPHTILFGEEIANWIGREEWNTGKWYAGYVDAIGLPVIPYELDHAIGR